MVTISGNKITVDLDVVLSEKMNRTGKVTSYPIEDNNTANDHFAKNPISLNVTGVCTTDGANKIANLSKLWNDGALCEYIGRNWVGNVNITNLNTDHGSNFDKTFGFTMLLTIVKVSSTKEVAIQPGTSPEQNAAQVSPQSNIGTSTTGTKNADAATQTETTKNALNNFNVYVPPRDEAIMQAIALSLESGIPNTNGKGRKR